MDSKQKEKIPNNIIVLYPGGFKPLTGGHLSLITKYSSLPEVKEIKLLIGAGIRDGIDQSMAINIAYFLLGSNPKVSIEASPYPSPILNAYKYVTSAAPGYYALASSSKENDLERSQNFVEEHQPGGKYYESLGEGVKVIFLDIDPSPGIYHNRSSDEYEGKPISASILRKDLKSNNLKDFYSNYPDINPEIINKIKESLIFIHNKKESPQLNKHMPHIEDLVILEGMNGIDRSLNIFKSLLKKDSNINLSVKIDGAPAIFVWSKFKGLDGPGIATKSLFAKDPIILYDEEDVDLHYSDKPQLAYKLKSFLNHLDSLKIPQNQIWQGDFLFDDKSLIREKRHYAFHPNTIYYVISKKSDFGKSIKWAEVGIVWHTRYKGKDLSSVSAKYDIDVRELNQNPKVFMIDPYIRDLSKIIYYEKDMKLINLRIIDIESLRYKLFLDLKSYFIVIENQKWSYLFFIFLNSLIKRGIELYPTETLEFFIKFIEDRFAKEEDKRKTERGKSLIRNKMDEIILFTQKYEETIKNILRCMNAIKWTKELLLERLNRMNEIHFGMGTYLNIENRGLCETNHEGFVISDSNGNIVKLVDRKEFSRSNFDPEIIKGWS